MLAVAWSVARGVAFRAAAGRAVRAPTYVERYFNTVSPRPGGNLGNPDLRAERAWNAEGGVDLRPAPGVAFQATAFWRRTDSLIDFVRTRIEGEDVFLAQNVLEAGAAGVEATATAGRRFNPEQAVRLTAAYTYTDVQIDPGAFAAGDFKYVLDHSPHLIQGRAALEIGRALLTVEALHKTRVALASVTVANARLAVAPRAWADAPPVEVYVEARNVFDAQYTEVFGAPMPGRLWLAGLRLRLGGPAVGL
jgi:outer membrane receptor protein involved in Fe transport